VLGESTQRLISGPSGEALPWPAFFGDLHRGMRWVVAGLCKLALLLATMQPVGETAAAKAENLETITTSLECVLPNTARRLRRQSLLGLALRATCTHETGHPFGDGQISIPIRSIGHRLHNGLLAPLTC
jgi:hypothetical protein